MGKIIRIGMDTSKTVFQLHGVDEGEQAILRRKLRRQHLLSFFQNLDRTRIGLEACGGSHHWARALQALGHDVVLLPPQHVKPYVARGKNDAADAEAVCEAMSRPKVQKRFVAVKTAEQQGLQMLMGVRTGLKRRRTQVSNAIRGNACEFGFTAPKGLAYIEPLLARLQTEAALPVLAREMFLVLAGQYRHVSAQIADLDARLMALHRRHELSQRLAQVPTVGTITAMALSARVTDAKTFRSARDFAAWIGLTPKDHSTAGRMRHGVITRAGDEMLRALLVCGATSFIQQVAKGRNRAAPTWLNELLRRKPKKLVAVALANKTARIAWKLMVSGDRYDPRKVHTLGCALEHVETLDEAA